MLRYYLLYGKIHHRGDWNGQGIKVSNEADDSAMPACTDSPKVLKYKRFAIDLRTYSKDKFNDYKSDNALTASSILMKR